MTLYRRRNYKLVKSAHGYDRVIEAGRAPMRRREQEGQIAIFNDLRPRMAADRGKTFLALHVGNGGYRTPVEARKLKEMGVMPGAADILLMLPHDRTEWTTIEGEKIPFVRLSPDEKAMPALYPRAVWVELKAIDPPPAARFKKNGEPFKVRTRNPKSGQEKSQADFERLVTGLGFSYHLIAFFDPRDAVTQFRALMKSYAVPGFP